MDDLPFDGLVVVREFHDFDHAILRDVSEMLPRVRRRPPDLNILDFRRLAKPDVLLEWRGSKGPTARDLSLDGTRAAGDVGHSHLDSCADRGAIAFHTH